VVALTKWFEHNIEAVFKEPLDDVDREFKEHLVFVFNQVLQNLRKTGVAAHGLERIGKLLFRLYMVFQAYKKKKKRYSLSEWVEQVLTLGKELNDAVGG
jgi:hypothetical protein